MKKEQGDLEKVVRTLYNWKTNLVPCTSLGSETLLKQQLITLIKIKSK